MRQQCNKTPPYGLCDALRRNTDPVSLVTLSSNKRLASSRRVVTELREHLYLPMVPHLHCAEIRQREEDKKGVCPPHCIPPPFVMPPP